MQLKRQTILLQELPAGKTHRAGQRGKRLIFGWPVWQRRVAIQI